MSCVDANVPKNRCSAAAADDTNSCSGGRRNFFLGALLSFPYLLLQSIHLLPDFTYKIFRTSVKRKKIKGIDCKTLLLFMQLHSFCKRLPRLHYTSKYYWLYPSIINALDPERNRKYKESNNNIRVSMASRLAVVHKGDKIFLNTFKLSDPKWIIGDIEQGT